MTGQHMNITQRLTAWHNRGAKGQPRYAKDLFHPRQRKDRNPGRYGSGQEKDIKDALAAGLDDQQSKISTQSHDDLLVNDLIILAEEENPTVDVVLVHGLGGHPLRTWTDHSENTTEGAPICWPRDSLPKELLKHDIHARIMTFGYNSTPYISGYSTQTTVEYHAKLLLSKLELLRGSSKRRQLIFIGHSLGCVIIENAMVQASIAIGKEGARAIKLSTTGLFLLEPSLEDGLSAKKDRCMSMLKNMKSLGWREDSSLETFLEKASSLGLLLDEFASITQHFTVCYLETEFDLNSAICTKEENMTHVPVLGLTEESRQTRRAGTRKSLARRIRDLILASTGRCSQNWYKFDQGLYDMRDSPQCARVSNHFKGVVIPSHRMINPFLGRQAALDFMINHFETPTSDGSLRIMIIQGAAAMGKTELAYQYIDHHRANFSFIFWIDAFCHGTIQASFMRIARILLNHYKTSFSNSDDSYRRAAEYLGFASLLEEDRANFNRAVNPASIINAINNWLCWTCHKEWLIVFDNVQIKTVELCNFFPGSSSGSVLMITREKKELPWKILSLGPLDQKDAVGLGFLNTPGQFSLSRQWMEITVQALDCVPGHIIDAMALISTAPDMESIGRITSRDSDRDTSSYNDDLLATLHIVNRITASSQLQIRIDLLQEISPLSVEILDFCSTFSNSPLPSTILKRGYFKDRNCDLHEFDIAIGLLVEHNFASLTKAPVCLCLNRDVYLWKQGRIDWQPNYGEAVAKSIRILSLGLGLLVKGSAINTPESWQTEQHLIPHFLTIRRTIEVASSVRNDPTVWFALGDFCKDIGLYTEADSFYKLVQTSDNPGEDGKLLLKLGVLNRLQNRFGDAEAQFNLLRKSVDIKSANFSHALDELAFLYYISGQLEKARTAHEELIQRESGTQYALQALETLAMIYQRQEKFNEAKVFYRRVYASRICANQNEDCVTSATDFITRRTASRLASVYQQQGHFEAAKRLLEEIHAITKSRLGGEHPLSLDETASLAILCDLQGRFTEAQENYDKAWKGRCTWFGECHKDTVGVLENRALSCFKFQDLKKSCLFYHEVLSWKARAGEEDRVREIATRIADMYEMLGQESDAKKMRDIYLNLDHVDSESQTWYHNNEVKTAS